MRHYDIEFFWDPVCPFAWITSRWITKVSAQTGYKVDWRFISLRLLNKDKDYATQFPPNYERGHTAVSLARGDGAAQRRAAPRHLVAPVAGCAPAAWGRTCSRARAYECRTLLYYNMIYIKSV